MLALRAWLMNVNPRPKWFEARLLKWTGLKPDEVNRTLNFKKGDEPLPAEQIGKLQDFMATYRAGGISEYDDSRIAEEPNQKQERILDRPGFERPVPERPNGTKPAENGTEAPKNGTPAPKSDEERWKMILIRYSHMAKPIGWPKAFAEAAQIDHNDISRMRHGTNLTNLNGKYDRIEAALTLSERGMLPLDSDSTQAAATATRQPPMIRPSPKPFPEVATPVPPEPKRVFPIGVLPPDERRTAVAKLMEIRQKAAEVVEAVDAVLEEVRADLETLEKVRQLAGR